MLRDIAFYMFFIISLISVCHLGFYTVGANIYDIVQLFRKKSAAKPRRGRRYQPLISIIVPAHNETSGIKRTLDSIIHNDYPNMEIIVVNDGSTDNTAKVVRDYIRYHKNSANLNYYMARSARTGKLTRRYLKEDRPKIRIELVNQKNAGKAVAVNNGIINHAKGSLVMTLDGDSILQTDTIKNAVRYFQDKKVVGVAANVRILDNQTMLGLLQKFEHLTGYRSKKFYTLSNSEFIVGGVASTYRMSILKKVGFYDTDTQTEDIGLSMKIVSELGNTDKRIVYAADVVAGTEGVQSYKALFRQRFRWKLGMMQNLFKYRAIMLNNDEKYSRALAMYRLPMAFLSELILLVEPLLLAYIIYLSIKLQVPTALVGSYLTITLYILWTLWPDEHMKLKTKLKQSLFAPLMYFLFYIMNAVQVVAMVRCLFNYKKVFGLVEVDGRWVSPERSHKTQAVIS